VARKSVMFPRKHACALQRPIFRLLPRTVSQTAPAGERFTARQALRPRNGGLSFTKWEPHLAMPLRARTGM